MQQDSNRTEGIRTYLCPSCSTFFAIVTPLVPQSEKNIFCPECKEEAYTYGEGFIVHKPNFQPLEQSVDHLALQQEIVIHQKPKYEEQFPYVLNSQHIQDILDIGKEKAYELMESKGFPVLKVGRHKKVLRDKFFQWLHGSTSID